jgi:hypothetical protein
VKRVVGGFALLAGAALAVVGLTRPLFEQTRMDSGYRNTIRLTMWGSEYSSAAGTADVSPTPVLFGVPVVAAVVLLAVAAVLVAAGSRVPEAPTRVLAVAAPAWLIGSVWTVGQLVLVAADQDDITRGTIDTVVSDGTWTLVAACAVALAGGLLVQGWSVVAPEPEDAVVYQLPDDDDTDTPPMGVPIHPSVSTEESSPG